MLEKKKKKKAAFAVRAAHEADFKMIFFPWADGGCCFLQTLIFLGKKGGVGGNSI